MRLNGPDQNSWQRTQCLPILLLLKLKYMGEAAQQCRIKTDWLASLRKTTLVVTKQAVANVGGGAEQPPTGELRCDAVTRVGAFLE